MAIQASEVVIMPPDEYGAHVYMDWAAPDQQKAIQKEQGYVNKTGKPRLIHPHAYSEKCGNMKHTRLVPNGKPEEVRIIS